MTLGELIEELELLVNSGVSQDTPVAFHYNYGDHWNSRVAEVPSVVEVGLTEWSEYHRMYKVSDDQEKELTEMVLIGGIAVT